MATITSFLSHEPEFSLVVSNHLTTILPLPAGEGRGEGELFEQESCAVHGEGAFVAN